MSRRALALVFALFVGIPLVFMTVGLLLPGEVEVERSTVVPVSAEVAFRMLDSAEKWASYQRRERTVGKLDFQVTGLERGVGSGLQYYISGKLVATFKIRWVEPPSLIEYGFSWEGAPLSGRGVFRLEPVENGTRVTRREVARIGADPLYRWLGRLGMAERVGQDFDSFFDQFSRAVAEGL
ncbi:MAG: SRPBCC family protein [Myxococcota bacterium]